MAVDLIPCRKVGGTEFIPFAAGQDYIPSRQPTYLSYVMSVAIATDSILVSRVISL